MVVKNSKLIKNEMTEISRSLNWVGDQNIVGYRADKYKILCYTYIIAKSWFEEKQVIELVTKLLRW